MSNVLKTLAMILLTLTTAADIDAQAVKKLDKYFKRKMKKANLAGIQMALIKDGKTQWVGSYGYRDFESGLPVNNNTLFMIASCSKPVTALGALKLHEDGLLDLDQDINAYLPFKVINPNYPNTLVTCRMLMTHMSSFRDNSETMNSLYTMDEGGDSPESLESFVKNYFVEGGKYYNKETNFLNAVPTTEKSYCNAGYALLGYIIEVVSGKPFSEFIKENIFKPLDMTSSYWFLSQIESDNISKPHEYIDNDTKVAEYKTLNHYGYPDYPDGQLRTNVKDYAQFINLILNKGKHDGIQLFKEETIAEFLKVQYPETNEYQALAWNYNEFDNWIYYLLMPRLPSHTGVDPGVATVVSFDPEKKIGAIIFSNTLTTSFMGHKIFYQEMMKKLLKAAR